MDTVVLGCTHFPLLAASIGRQVGAARSIVDSAATTARATAAMLAEHNLVTTRARPGMLRLMATDSPERFARVGARFLGSSLAARTIEAIDL